MRERAAEGDAGAVAWIEKRNAKRRERDRGRRKGRYGRIKAMAEAGDEIAAARLAKIRAKAVQNMRRWTQRMRAAASEGDPAAVLKMKRLRRKESRRKKRKYKELRAMAAKGDANARVKLEIIRCKRKMARRGVSPRGLSDEFIQQWALPLYRARKLVDDIAKGNV